MSLHQFHRRVRIVFLSVAVVFAAGAAGAQSPLRIADRPLPSDEIAAPGDYDGDGDLDGLGWTNGAFDGTVLVNDGHARFVAVPAVGLAIPSYATPEHVLSADFNGDGRADLFVHDRGPFVPGSGWGIVVADQLWLCGPGFVFAAGAALPVPGSATIPGASDLVCSAAAGDVDLDGDVDLVVGVAQRSPWADGVPETWLNNGSAVFSKSLGAAPSTNPAPAGQVHLIDLDGDGDRDAVFGFSANHSTVPRVFLNAGGVFAPHPLPPFPPPPAGVLSYLSRVYVGDFNGDGYSDLATYMFDIVISLGGAVGFGAWTWTGSYTGAYLAGVADFDSDAKSELILETAAGISIVAVPAPWIGAAPTPLATPVVYPPGESWTPVPTPLADWDGDGDQDASLGALGLLMNDGAGSPVWIRAHGAMTPIHLPTFNLLTVYADLNGDGLVDVLQQPVDSASTSLFEISVSDGAGGFLPLTAGAPTSPVAGHWPSQSVAADFDADGNVDLYVMRPDFSPYPSDLYFPGLGATGFGPAVALPPPSFGAAASAGNCAVACDLDRDGDLDLVMAPRSIFPGYPGATAAVVMNAGGGLFVPPAALGATHRTSTLLVGDFDGDGDDDVLQVGMPASPTTAAEPSILWQSRLGGPVASTLTGASGLYAAVGDFNVDGTDDVVLDGGVVYFVGGATVAGPLLPQPLVSPTTAADIDGDGYLDLVGAFGELWTSLGGVGFAAPSAAPSPNAALFSTPRSAVSDLDDDGDLDVVTPGPRVLNNVSRHLAQRRPPRIGRPFDVDVYGTAGGAWALFASPAIARLPVPPYGTLLIDPSFLVPMGAGVHPPAGAPGAGVSAATFVVPNLPALVGLTLHWQAFDVAAALVTNRLTSVIDAY